MMSDQSTIIKNAASFLESAFDLYFVIDSNSKILEAKGRVSDLLGYPEKKLVGSSITTILAEQSIDNWILDFESFFAENKIFKSDIQFENKIGKIVDSETYISPASNKGQFLVVVSKKKDESGLTGIKYRKIFNSSIEPILLIDGEHKVEFNLAAEKLFRCDVPNDKNKCKSCVDSFVDGLVKLILERAQRQSYKFTTTVKRAGGEFVADVASTPFFINGKIFLQTSIQDVTERTVLENELISEQKRWQRMMEILPVGVFVADEDGNNLYANKNIFPMTGFSNVHGEEKGAEWIKTIHPDDIRFVQREWQKMVKGEKDFSCLHRYVVDGKAVWVHGIASLLGVEDDRKMYLGSLQNVTDVVLASEKLEHILRNISEIIYVLDKNACFLEVYESEKEKLHMKKEALIGKPISELYDEEFLHKMKHHIQGSLFTDRVFTFEYNQEIDGYIKYFQARISKLTEESVVVSVRNITHEKEALNELEAERVRSIEASKLATLGEMSAGIAHEINNPLAVISGKMQRLKTLHETGRLDDDKLVETIDKTEKTVQRISRIVTGLRTFARDGSQDPFEPVSVKDIVEDTIALCSEKFKNHAVKLTVDKFRPDLKIEAVNIQISQVVLNLLSNAYDAIEENEGDKWIKVIVKENEETVTISVMDSGDGIPEDIARKILHPFFTTKPVGKGTGLGLSISKSIVESHNGVFRIDDTCSNTKFDIVLPKEQSKETKTEKSSPAA